MTAYSFDSASSGNAAAAIKKSFTADNGLKYKWDDVEDDWVEFEGPDRSVANILSLINEQHLEFSNSRLTEH